MRFPERLVLLVAGLVAFAAAAQTSSWQALGPPGGSVTAILVDPRTPARVFVGTERAGVFKSENDGATWSPSSTGLAAASVTKLAAHPSTAGTFYAATTNGLFRTTNTGASWTGLSAGDLGSVDALAVNAAGALYAGSATYSPADGAPRIQKSTNGGTSWTALTLPGAPGSVLSIAAEPTGGSDVVYACVTTEEGGFFVFQSSNGGTSWVDVTGAAFGAFSVHVDPATPATLYAVTLMGVSRSTNGGTDWVELAGGLPEFEFPTAFAIDPSSPANLLVAYAPLSEGSPARVLRSTDRGATWTSASTGLPSAVMAALAVKPGTSARLYSGSPAGVFASSNAGASWASANASLGALLVSALAVDGTAGGGLWVGASGGGHRSGNRGASWTSLNLPGPVPAIAVHPTDPSVAYAISGRALKRTTNGGGSWSDIGGALPDGGFEALVIAPSQPATLYAGSCGEGVFRSTNSAAAWTATGGATVRRCVTMLAVDPVDPLFVVAAANGGWTTDGLVVTTNGGSSWTAAGATLPSAGGIGAVAVQGGTPRRVYAAVTGQGVYVSTSNGSTWSAVTSLAQGSGPFAVDAVAGGRLFASGDLGGVWVTDDGAASWRDLTGGLQDVAVTRLAVDPAGNWLYAATVSTGVYALALPPRVDAGAPDSGVVVDAGVPDAGRPDSGVVVDAGVPDAGRPDSGVVVDAGVPDAGRPDAGRPDAGDADSGTPDSGEVDAGSATDAGTVDSGVAVDAGSQDSGVLDAGALDAGPLDGSAPDAGGESVDGAVVGGCGCSPQAAPPGWYWLGGPFLRSLFFRRRGGRQPRESSACRALTVSAEGAR